MLAVALFPSLAAVIVAAPAATPVTRPVPSTDATFAFDDVQLIVRPKSALPFASRGVALSFTVFPIELTVAVGVEVGVVVPGPAGESEPQATRETARAAARAEMRARCMSRYLQAVGRGSESFAPVGCGRDVTARRLLGA